jgi:hypothetical protein
LPIDAPCFTTSHQYVMFRVFNPRLREIKEPDVEAMLAAMIDKLPGNDRNEPQGHATRAIEPITLNLKNVSPL